MNDSNPSSHATSPRPTLKLKVAPRKSVNDHKAAPVPLPQSNPKSKSGAHWSDEYKNLMQADMDALRRR
jgi:hypothetical protein